MTTTQRIMRIYVNGEERSALQHTTVEELLTSLGLAQRPCAVEVNRTLVPRREHARWRLEQDDRVEIVELVGGG